MSLKGSMRRRRSGSPRICETRSRAHETCAASEEAGLGFAGRLSVLGPRHPALPQRRPPVRVRVTLLLPGHQRLAPKARAQTGGGCGGVGASANASAGAAGGVAD